jgi:vitamin B12 transporter
MISLAFGIGASVAVWADESEIPVYEEEEVVITATRTRQEESKAPGRTEVITKEEIEASGAATVAEVLQKEGVVISTYGGASGSATVQLDGTDAKQTLVLVNGIPANTGCIGEVDLSYFPTTGVSRIEIAHGPLSSLYGANALGGVVNIITDLTGKAHNQVTLTGGSNQYSRLAMAFKQEKFGVAFGGNYTDGHRARSATTNTFLMSQVDLIQNEKTNLIMDLLYKAKNNQSPGSLGYNPKEDGFEETTSLDLSGSTKNGNLVLEYKLFGQYLVNRLINIYTDDRHSTKSFGTDFAGQYCLKNHQLLSGIMLRQDDFDSTASGQHTRNDSAIFMQDMWTITPDWLLTTGLRWDTGSDYSSPICPRINVTHVISDAFSIKLGYGKAFRAPTIHDLYWTGQGNPDLEPEYGDRYDLTGEWRRDNHSITVNLYQADLAKAILWQSSDPNDDDALWYPYNVGKLRIQGFNAQWSYQWNQYIGSSFGYSWTEKKKWDDAIRTYTDYKNDNGKNSYNFGLNFNEELWLAGFNWNYVTDRENLSDYSIINLSVKYRLSSNLNYSLTVNNCMNEEYQIRKGYPMPGREYYLTANYTF